MHRLYTCEEPLSTCDALTPPFFNFSYEHREMKQALDIGGSDPLDADRKEAEV